MKKTISEAIKERVLILDGAMGTQIFNHNPTIEDYGGIEFDGCVEMKEEKIGSKRFIIIIFKLDAML